MTNQMILKDNLPSTIETAVIVGDLSKLTPEQRVSHYMAVCKSTGLNPLTKPFDYITLSGRLVLYARKDATDQLRKANRVSIVKLDRETINGVYVVTAHARDDQGREDSSIGAVNIEKVQGDALANAMMKAETKAKRRVTLSICGLGWLDETEIETIPDAHRVVVSETGEIESYTKQLPDQPPAEQKTFNGDNARPYGLDTIKAKLAAHATSYKGKPTDKQIGLIAMLIEKAFAGKSNAAELRHEVQFALFGHESLRDCDPGILLAALNAWLKPTQDSGGDYQPDPMAVREIQRIQTEALKSEGQQTLI